MLLEKSFVYQKMLQLTERNILSTLYLYNNEKRKPLYASKAR